MRKLSAKSDIIRGRSYEGVRIVDGMAEQKMGTSEAFSEIYKRYYQEIYRYVYHRVQNTYVAEDIVQETFYTALTKGNDFLTHPYPGRWLLCTAHNKIREFSRRMRHWASLSLEQDDLELSDEERGYETKELELTAAAALSREEWKLLCSYYLVGVPVSELAQDYGITPENLRVRLTLLKKKLRSWME